MMRFQEAFRLAEQHQLEADSCYWALPCGGEFLATLVAKKGILPKGFNLWHLADKNGWTVAHIIAQKGQRLPDVFHGWHWRNGWGWTVAHYAAQYGTLPHTFNEWHWQNSFGWTVAHVAVAKKKLICFDGWHWVDKYGITVLDQAKTAISNQI